MEKSPVISTESAFTPAVQETLKELRALAIPLARFLLEKGMLDGEVRINTFGVNLWSPAWGCPFTQEDEAEIFREEAARVKDCCSFCQILNLQKGDGTVLRSLPDSDIHIHFSSKFLKRRFPNLSRQ